MIELSKIRIDGGTHYNYVIEFSDGTTKIGVTRRPNKRLAEIVTQKNKTNECATVLSVSFSPPSSKEAALKTEKNICSLLKRRALTGRREWFSTNENYIQQVSCMFWNMNSYNRSSVWMQK